MRDLRWDNLRFVLIFLAAFGHALELCPGQVSHVVYQAIYTFHMPAFVFMTGYFAKFRWRGVASLCICYAVFQTLYLLFAWGVLGGAQGMPQLDYLTPYWLMWYLMATIFYYLLVPALGRVRGKARVAVLAACVAVSLLAGYLPAGRFLTLGRFLAYLPCFAAGYYAHALAKERAAAGEAAGGGVGRAAASAGAGVTGGRLPAVASALRREGWGGVSRLPAVAASCACLAVGGCVALQFMGVSNEALYNAGPYAASGSNAGVRALQLAAAAGCTGLLLAVVPNRQLPQVTRIGQNTMPVFLFHGFVVRWAGMFGVWQFGDAGCIALALAFACVLVFAFGWPSLNSVVRFTVPDRRK